MQGLAAHGARPVLFVSGSPNVAGDAAPGGSRSHRRVRSSTRPTTTPSARPPSDPCSAAGACGSASARRSHCSRASASHPTASASRSGSTPVAARAPAGGRGSSRERPGCESSSGRRSRRSRSQRTRSSARSGHGAGERSARRASTPTSPPPRASTSGHETRRSATGRPSQGPGSTRRSSKDRSCCPAAILCGLSGGRRIPAADVTRLDHAHPRPPRRDRRALRTPRPPLDGGRHERPGARRRERRRSRAASAATGPRTSPRSPQAERDARRRPNVIRDELRRRAIVAKLAAAGSTQPPLQWMADRTAQAVNFTICRKDELPGSGDFPRSDARDVGVVPLPGLLPVPLRRPHRRPRRRRLRPRRLRPARVSLAWSYGPEPDLAGYEVFRSPTAGGPYAKLTRVAPRPAGVHRPERTARRPVVLRRPRRRQLGERERPLARDQQRPA